MSGPGAYRFAAWPGLVPQPPRYERAPEALAQRIARTLGDEGLIERLANAGEAHLFFRFTTNAGTRSFVKLIGAEREAEIEEAEALARWLHERHAPVLPALSQHRFDESNLLLAYPYLEGRPPSPTVEDARELGRALGELHRALAAHPAIGQWGKDTRRRAQMLEGVRAKLSAGELRAGPDPDRLAQLARDESIALEPAALASTATPLHGDLNLFNVVMTGQGALFLDLEDVHHSVLPAEFDVAKLCERAILVQESRDDRSAAAIDALLRAYAQSSGAKPIDAGILPTVLRTLALRALCTLAAIDPEADDRAEWEKFFHLMDAAGARDAAFGARRASA